MKLTIRPLAGDADIAVFRALDEEWIQHHFVLEAEDRPQLDDPARACIERSVRINAKGPLSAGLTVLSSGGGGIRTHGTGVTRTTVFETARFNRSRTPPGRARRVATVRSPRTITGAAPGAGDSHARSR